MSAVENEPCLLDNIPAELRAGLWNPFKLVWNEDRGKDDKIPFNASTGWAASTKKPDQWHPFDDALAAYKRGRGSYDGIGKLCRRGEPTGVDLDKCRNLSTGEVEWWAQAVVDKLNSYTEISPSATGLRIYVIGDIPTDIGWSKDSYLEMYAGHRPRFLTVTGNVYGEPKPVADRPQEILEVHAQYKGADKPESEQLPMPDIGGIEVDLDQLVELKEETKAFLIAGSGEVSDRSTRLAAACHELYELGLGDSEVFSVLANGYGLDIALDHRQQDAGKALHYLWLQHALKCRRSHPMHGFVADGELLKDCARRHSDEPPPGDTRPKPIDLRRRLNEPRVYRTYLFRDPKTKTGLFVEGTAGLVHAGGGTGKTQAFALQMGVSLATGGLWLGRYEPIERRHTLVFTAEDDEPEVVTRLHDIIDHLVESTQSDDDWHASRPVPDAYRKQLIEQCAERLHIYPVIGKAFPLTKQHGREYMTGPAVDYIVERINTIGEPCVSIMDPLRRFTVGDENGEAFNAVIKALDRIRSEPEHASTPLVTHHSSKFSMRESDSSSAAARGSTVLVDGVRFAVTLRALSDAEVKSLPGVKEETRYDYRAYAISKFNAGPLSGDRYLCWHNGVFIDEGLTPADDADAMRCAAVGLVLILKKLGGEATKRQLRDYTGLDREIRIARDRIGPLLDDAEQRNLVTFIEIRRNRNTCEGVKLTELGAEMVARDENDPA